MGVGTHKDEGPEVRYIYHDKILSLHVGVELFDEPYFKGSLSYFLCKNAFEGSIKYLGEIFWVKDPEITVRWSKKEGLQIIKFIIPKLHIAFNLLGAIAKFAKVLYKLVTGIISWGIQFSLRTDKNPNPDRYLVKLVLSGNITVSVAGFFTNKLIPLPEIPIRIIKMKDFTLSKLPEFIGLCLWESAGDICKSLLRYINPVNLVNSIVKNVKESIVNTTMTVVNVITNVGKKVLDSAKKVWSGFKKVFGFSAFLVDSTHNTILGYVEDVRNGKRLHNIKYTVDNFGDFLIANFIGKIAKDVHTNATVCMQFEGKNDYSDDLDKLPEETQNLSSKLDSVAHDVLAVTDITVNFCHDVLCIKWQVGNNEGKVYSEDKGDIEYHVKVIMTVVQVRTQKIYIKKIYDDMLTPVYPNNQEQNEDQLNSQDSKTREVLEEGTMHKDQQALLESSLDAQIDQFQGEQQYEEKGSETSLSADDKKTDDTQLTKDAIENFLSANIPIDHTVLKQALCIFVSIKPTVTLRIKTLPPEKDPRIIDEEMLKCKDKQWMQDIKDEINKSGREKEVTLIGKAKCSKYFLKSTNANTKSELIINASFVYSEQAKALTVKGEIKKMPEASYYLIQVTDTSDETIVIKSKLISSTSPCLDGDDNNKGSDDHNYHNDITHNNVFNDDNINNNSTADDNGDHYNNDNDDDRNDNNDVGDYASGNVNNDSISSCTSSENVSTDDENESQGDDNIGFSFDIKLQEIPDDSLGPYSITSYALTEALEYLHITTVSDTKMDRRKPPTSIDVELPFSKENTEVVLKWEPDIDQDEHMFDF